MKRVAVLLVFSAVACGPASVPAALVVGDQALSIIELVVRSLRTVSDFVKTNAAPVDRINESIAKKDYFGAALALTQVITELERRGAPIPPEVQRAQQIVGAVAATAIEQGMRALVCGNPKGCAP
jgi:hypothetical protein